MKYVIINIKIMHVSALIYDNRIATLGYYINDASSLYITIRIFSFH